MLLNLFTAPTVLNKWLRTRSVARQLFHSGIHHGTEMNTAVAESPQQAAQSLRRGIHGSHLRGFSDIGIHLVCAGRELSDDETDGGSFKRMRGRSPVRDCTDKGFGFTTPEERGDDVFIHRSQLVRPWNRETRCRSTRKTVAVPAGVGRKEPERYEPYGGGNAWWQGLVSFRVMLALSGCSRLSKLSSQIVCLGFCVIIE